MCGGTKKSYKGKHEKYINYKWRNNMSKLKKVMIICVLVCTLIGMTVTVNASNTVNENEIKNFLATQTSVDLNNITEADVITIYEELSDKYTNEELADMVEEYKDELQEEGIDEDTINTGITLLKTTDSDELKQVLQENLDMDEVKEKLNEGQDLDTIVEDMQIDPLSIAIKILLTNIIVKAILYASLVYLIYMLIVRWRIYKKAEKHAWASIVPIYRDVVWFKMAGITPWVLLLWLVPVIGWISLILITIISKFQIAKAFDRSGWFGLGLWLIPIVFESIIAFSKKVKYLGDAE